MAVFSALGNLGFAAGPTVIAFFIAAWGWRASPWLILPAVIVVGLLFVLLPPRRVDELTGSGSEISLRGLLADRAGVAAVLRLIFINFCLTVGLRGLQTFLGIHLVDLGSSVTSVGLLLTATLALGAIVSIFVSSLLAPGRQPGADRLLGARRPAARRGGRPAPAFARRAGC